jgi:hypothetical protein
LAGQVENRKSKISVVPHDSGPPRRLGGAAAVIHGSLNATAGLALVVVKGGNDLLVGVQGLAGFIVLAAVNIAIFIYERTFAREPVMKPNIVESIAVKVDR